MTRPNHTPPKLTRIANMLGCTIYDIAPAYEPECGHAPWFIIDPEVGYILGCGDSREQAIDESLQTARAYLRNRVAKALA